MKLTDRSAAARKGWITRRRNAARAAGAPILLGRAPTYHPGAMYFQTTCITCGRDWFADGMVEVLTATNPLFAALRAQGRIQ